MKTPTDDIFKLVQAMTAAEKRYFKIHFSSEKSLVTELFNYINGMKAYDEEDVKTHFKDSKLSKNLKVYKIMLSDLLLKSLSSFRYKKSINSIIRQNLEEVEILTEKCLYTQAYKKLQKTKKLCLKHEEFTQLITIINLEYRFKAFYEINVKNESLELLDNTIYSSTKILDILKLKKINHELSLNAGEVAKAKINNTEVKKHESFLMKNLADKLDSKDALKETYYAHSALGHLYHSTKNIKKEYQHKKDILELFQNNTFFVDSNPNKYWSSCFNFANCCMRDNRSDEFNETLKKIKAFTKRFPFFKRKMILVHVMEIVFHLKQKNYSYIVNDLEPVILETVNLYGDEQERSVVFSYLSLMRTHLSIGNHTQVQYYLRRLFKKKGIGKAFNYFYETIDLISHFESKDFDILQNLLTAKKRKIKREPKYGTPFYKEILKFFSNILDPKKNVKEQVVTLKKIASEHPDDDYLRLMQYFLFEDWMNALSEGKTYSEYVNPDQKKVA